MDLQQIMLINAPIRAIIFLKAHFFFKDNNTKTKNMLKIWQIAIQFDVFKLFSVLEGTFLCSSKSVI